MEAKLSENTPAQERIFERLKELAASEEARDAYPDSVIFVATDATDFGPTLMRQLANNPKAELVLVEPSGQEALVRAEHIAFSILIAEAIKALASRIRGRRPRRLSRRKFTIEFLEEDASERRPRQLVG